MSNKTNKISTLSKKILEGVKLASKKMIDSKKKNNGEIVVFQNGEISVIPAQNID
ncbi:hypothetical protein JYT74_01210 [Crocinitomix catalasitica]|nr:hypothetical protein [Crocinitomix catalasitica]